MKEWLSVTYSERELGMQFLQNRRDFLAGLSAIGAASMVGVSNAVAQSPPETTAVRLAKFFPAGCDTPQYVAAELLRAEGISDVHYIDVGGEDSSVLLARGEVDFDWNYAAINVASIDAGAPITVLAGMHSGCLELIAGEGIRGVTDLKGKKVGVYAISSSPHILVTLMAAYVGLDPKKDIEWVADPKVSPMELFASGKIDAFLATPPEPQDLRARKIGHTIVSTATDAPWSIYYCCMLTGTNEYVQRYPIATKRVLRSLLKTVDLCLTEPQTVAQRLIDGGFASSYDFAVQTLNDVRYDRWRDFDPEDSLRFYALRMQEVGLIKRNPNDIILAGSDWRFINELRRELKT
jgi:NitT/TauT family transport system substrate-binding protein